MKKEREEGWQWQKWLVKDVKRRLENELEKVNLILFCGGVEEEGKPVLRVEKQKLVQWIQEIAAEDLSNLTDAFLAVYEGVSPYEQEEQSTTLPAKENP